MSTEQNEKSNRRKFVSITLFYTFVMMVVSAFVIQIFEAMESDFWTTFFTAFHALFGITFTVLSIIHVITNRKALFSYFKSAKGTILWETIAVLAVVLSFVILSVLIALD